MEAKNKLTIGLFTDVYYPYVSGVVTSVTSLKKELEKLGHTVYIITVQFPDHDLEDEPMIIRIPSIPFKKWEELRLGLPFSISNHRNIRRLGLDLIHTHTEFSVGLMGKSLAKSLNLPLVHTYHTLYEDYTHYIYSHTHGTELVKNIIRKTSKSYFRGYPMIIAPSHKTKKVLESYGVDIPIEILPTGIDLHHFKRPSSTELDQLRLKHHLRPDSPTLLFVGRLSQEKSIDVLLQGLKRGLATHPDLQLLLVGNGPAKEELEALTRQLELTNHVTFVGEIPHKQIGHYYALADLFINASKTETQGLTIMEAMAAKLPVIVYRDDNIEGIVEDHLSGYLFETVDEFVDQLTLALTNPKQMVQMAEKAYQIVQSLSTEAFGKNVEKLYYQLID